MIDKKNSYIVLAILSVACIGLVIYGVTNKKTNKNEETKTEVKEYSIEDLEKMAKEYYEKNNEKVENMEIASEKDENGLLKIQLFVKLEDHNSNLDFYTVDMKTGKGKNSKDEEIDLTKKD